MKIVADANIVDVAEHYRHFGELVLMPGRAIRAEHLRDADALLVRSITTVNRALLEHSLVQFVATATSGTDHLDLVYLQQAGITVADAAGANANAVVEYVLAALGELVWQDRLALGKARVSIIGYGHVGRRLYASLRALGVHCVLCDPFVQDAYPGLPFCSLEEALRSPVISLHTPLTREGPHPTWHMLDATALAGLAPGTVLINAARGEIVDNAALSSLLETPNPLTCVLDCWENEPVIHAGLLSRVTLGTPHIAGYSQEAKQGASDRILEAFLTHFRLADPRNPPPQSQAREEILLPSCADTSPARLLALVLRTALPLNEVDYRLRAQGGRTDAAMFDAIRASLTRRREFSHYRLNLSAWTQEQRAPALLEQCQALGFSISA